jgi:uncharacterized protein
LAQSELLCVYCRRERIDPAYRPFCSERCRMADLGRWLTEDYRVPETAPEHREPPGPAGADDDDDDH